MTWRSLSLFLLLSACTDAVSSPRCDGGACSDASTRSRCAWCTPGVAGCRNGNVVVCTAAAECAVYVESDVCSSGESCSFGRCSSSCVDECSAGETRCAGPSAIEVCGQSDSDPCMDWATPAACDNGETCSAGRCSSTCVDECELGHVRCRDNGISTCADSNDDGCNEWGPASSCSDDENCEGSEGSYGSGSVAHCADPAACTNLCTANACYPVSSGNMYSVCGNFDLDSCLEPSPGFACVPLACEAAECDSVRGCVLTNICIDAGAEDAGVEDAAADDAATDDAAAAEDAGITDAAPEDASVMDDAAADSGASVDASADTSTIDASFPDLADTAWPVFTSGSCQPYLTYIVEGDRWGSALAVTDTGLLAASAPGSGLPTAGGTNPETGAASRLGLGFANAPRSSNIGAVLTFGSRISGVYTEGSIYQPATTPTTPQFGTAVAAARDGTKLVIASQSGHLYTYTPQSSGQLMVDGPWTPHPRIAVRIAGSAITSPPLAMNAAGTLLLAGAADADLGAANSGAFVTYRPAASGWLEERVTTHGAVANQRFGLAVALSGDGMVAAVSFDDASAARGVGGNRNDTSAQGSGGVFIFRRTGTTWTEEAYLKPSNTDAGDAFGTSLALSMSGDLLVVGAPSEDSAARGINTNEADNTADGAGAAYLFQRSGSAWRQIAYLKASNTEAGDHFGGVVAMGASNIVAISALGEDSAASGLNSNAASNAAAESGAVYVFALRAGQWSQTLYLKQGQTNGQFGASLGFSATQLFVGAPGIVGGGATCTYAR